MFPSPQLPKQSLASRRLEFAPLLTAEACRALENTKRRTKETPGTVAASTNRQFLRFPCLRFPCFAKSGSQLADFSRALLQFCYPRRAWTHQIQTVEPAAADPNYARQPGIELQPLSVVRSGCDFSPYCRLYPQIPLPRRANRSCSPWPSLPSPRLPLHRSSAWRLR